MAYRKVLSDEDMKDIELMHDSGYSWTHIAAVYGVSDGFLFRKRKEYETRELERLCKEFDVVCKKLRGGRERVNKYGYKVHWEV